MSVIVVKVKRHDEDKDIPLPAYQTAGSAGCDIRSADTLTIPPGKRMLVGTGLRFEIPEGFECQIRPRSSLALKHGVIVFNTPSTIDSDYRGELKILLLNTGEQQFEIKRGDRVAQLVFAPVTLAGFETVDDLSDSERGEDGWGSTGRT